MKVLLVTGEYPPKQGGVGDYTHELGKALLALGVEADALTSGEEVSPLTDAALPSPGEPRVLRPVARWGWTCLPLILKQVREARPDVLHIQYQTAAFAMRPAINFLPWWTRKRLGQAAPRTVATFHDVKVPYLFPKAGPLRWWITLWLARTSEATIVTNVEDQQQLAPYRWRRTPYLIPIGSNIAPHLPAGYDRDQQRARWGFIPEDIVLCYFGFLNESKGGEALIRVLDRLVKSGYNSHLLMIGGKVGSSDPTNIAYAQHIDALVEASGLAERVRRTGFSEASEVSANLVASDICLLPYRDGASFRRGSFMAALAHGRPIVSTQPRVPIPQLVDGENIALAPPDDIAKLAARVEELIKNPQHREALGKGAQELSRSFGWDEIARQTVEVYRDLGAT